MTSSAVLSVASTSNLSTREYLVRTKLSRGHVNDHDRVIVLRIFDDSNNASEEILLNDSETQDQLQNNKGIDIFHVQTEEKLGEIIRRLKLHTNYARNENDKHERIFLKWIELTDRNTKHTFCFPVDDYLPSSRGDALELTEVHQDNLCEDNYQAETNTKSRKSDIPAANDKSKYDIRTKMGQQGFLGIKSLMKANVFLRLYDTNEQSSEAIPLTGSRLHHRPFRSNQTDQFEISTDTKLGPLKKVEIWHDGKKGTRLYCNTLEITDQGNGQVYCFQIKEHLESDVKLILTDYVNRRCIKTHNDSQRLSNEDETLESTDVAPTKTQLEQSKQNKSSPTTVDDDTDSNTDLNQTLFKVRTRVGHKGFLSLGMGGTDAKVNLRMHEGENMSGDIPLNNSLTHNNPFEAGHTDVFEISAPESINSPDRIEIFHNGTKHDGLYLKWIEMMNMKTLERKCFPVHRWLDANEGDKKTHLILTDFTLDKSCEETEYSERHSHDQYRTEYAVRTKTSPNQPMNNTDTSANIYLKIFNEKKKHTEDMLLSNSKHHSNPFRPGQTDHFDVGSIQLMDDAIDKIELWHDNKSNFNWFCDWIEIKNKKTGSIKCFGVNRLLSRQSSDGATKVTLTIQSNHPCDKIEHELHDLVETVPTNRADQVPQTNKRDYKKKYIITTRTGNKMLGGTNANVFVRLYDEQNRESEEIRLEQSVTNKIPFEKNAIDEFHTGTAKNLGDLKKIELWHTGGKHEGWNAQYVQIEDLDANRLYCFPVKKWLDSNSADRTTHVELTEFTLNEPCSGTSNRKGQKNLPKSSVNDSERSKPTNQLPQFKRTYHVETKTGKKGFLGLSPTGTNAKVYIRIYDQNGEASEPIQLQKSVHHKNKFERGQTDGFDVGSVQSLDGIDRLEVWHDGSGLGHGWFVDYISVIDNQTGEEACFFIGDYLNIDNGGVEEKHLILDKQTGDNRPCREHQFDAKESTVQESLVRGNIPSPHKQTYQIETKTGHTGLLGLGAAGTNAPVFVRIHDNNAEISEPMHLKNSLRHKNKFERNQTDLFNVGTRQELDGVKKLELWHEGDKHDGWQVDYVNVIDNKTRDSYCFLVNAMLDQNSGLKKTHILLENPSINIPCSEQFKTMKKAHDNALMSIADAQKNEKIQRNFTVRTKTGNQVEAGSTTPIHIQFVDNQEQKSEDIRLKHKDRDKHNFEPGAVDEFEITSSEPLSDQLIGIRVKHRAEKYQGWYAEWIEVTDEDNRRTYCYPIQRWIDKAENDKQTDVYFTEVSDVPCESLPDTMPETGRRSIPRNREAPVGVDSSFTPQSQTSGQTPTIPFKSTYHVKTKTGKKGFLGLSPTGTNAKVFMRVIDKNGDMSENLRLHRSTDHKNKFERGRTDEFDIGTSKELDGIDQIELWTDEKGVGNGWFPKYVEVTDNKTGDVACFPVNQYLNQKNGGIEGNPLRLKRITGDRPCQELIEERSENDYESEPQKNTTPNMKMSDSVNEYKSSFSVITKTGHTGFLGLGAAGTNAPVFIRIHDTQGKISEAIQLRNSTRHANKFERNQTDQFDIGTRESLVGVSRVELWHEGDKNDGWQIEYVQLSDNQTNTSYCFPVHAMLDQNSGLKETHVLLEKPLINVSCPEQTESLKRDRTNAEMTSSKKKKEKYERNLTIRTKTGDQIEAGSTTPIHIQLFDDQDQSSEDIRLKHKDREKHNFKSGAIDEFQVTSNQPLANQLTGIRVKHNADKYQGWYCEWIEITDDDHERTYCYPIQRWIDKAENDKKTDVFFTDTSNVPCDSLPNTMMPSARSSVPVNRKAREIESRTSPVSSAVPFENTYHVETKTGKKGFLGLSPTGTNADIFIQIIDLDGKKSEPIQLKKSTDHKNKFERNQTDEFDVGSTKSLNGIKQLEVWTDGKGFGHGWYADYVAVADNKTGEEACFLIGQYLNKEYGGVEENHLLLDKQIDDIPCREKFRRKEDDVDTTQTRQMKAVRPNKKVQDQDSAQAIPYKRTYHVDVKTGEKGFLGLSPTGTNAHVYLRIHDETGHVSEPIYLHRSTKHSNSFEKGNIDSFDVGTQESLGNISKLELYHNASGLGHGWNVEYVNIIDNTTEHSFCFPANKWINTNEHLILDHYLLDIPCEEVNKERMESKIDTKEKQKRSFTVRTKTGAQVEAGSSTPIYLRLYDDRSQKSEKLRLKQKEKDAHHFQPGSIDEFTVTSDRPLNTIAGIEVSHNADKYQGWYGEWISITDNDTNEAYCFPLQRWLDKGELDGKTDIYLHRQQNEIPCEELPETMQRQSLATRSPNYQTKPSETWEDYKSKYRVQVKTAKKGAFGLAPTGTDANVFMKIHDENGKMSEPIELKNSLNHKNKFNRGQIDDFNVGSIEDLNGVDKLELWTDGKGMSSGWYPEYLQITDQKTGEVNCFAVEQYLNERYGGSKDDHLLLNKQPNNQLCDQLRKEEMIESQDQPQQRSSRPNGGSQERFEVEIKTGHTGFLGLGGAGTDAPVFIQLHDSNDRKSEIFHLKQSIRHKNKFERNQTDQFLFHSEEPLADISKVDLWHEGTKNDGWQVDYLNITDTKTNTSYCFPVNAMLDRNSGLKQTFVQLENPSINAFCKEQAAAMKKTHSYTSASKRLKSEKSNGNYTVRTKTGDHPSAGSTTPIHLQLIDINDKKSKDIRMKKKDMEGHHFAPGAIDEFKFTIPESLSSLKAVKLSLDAEKYQGWYGEWISITDDDNQTHYCFPIQRWLDKGEADRKTHVTLYQQSDIPCHQIPDSMKIVSNQDTEPINPLSTVRRDENSRFEIRTQTADKSLKGKFEREANVYLNIYDKTNQQILDSIRLKNSKHHKTPFQRHHTDKFDLSIPNTKLADIDHIDLYHDGQNDGWFCDFVELKDLQTNETRCFSAHQWLDQLSDKRQFSMTNYQMISCDDKHGDIHYQYYTVRIKTETTNLSSNESIRTSIKLFGKSHQTEQIPFDQTVDNQQGFQRNHSIDTFEIRTSKKFNSLDKLEFYYDIQSINGKLSLEWIEVTNLSNGMITCFPINRILTQSDRNRSMAQVLTLHESTNQPCSS